MLTIESPYDDLIAPPVILSLSGQLHRMDNEPLQSTLLNMKFTTFSCVNQHPRLKSQSGRMVPRAGLTAALQPLKMIPGGASQQAAVQIGGPPASGLRGVMPRQEEDADERPCIIGPCNGGGDPAE